MPTTAVPFVLFVKAGPRHQNVKGTQTMNTLKCVCDHCLLLHCLGQEAAGINMETLMNVMQN